jgi:hypothetical protein
MSDTTTAPAPQLRHPYEYLLANGFLVAMPAATRVTG